MPEATATMEVRRQEVRASWTSAATSPRRPRTCSWPPTTTPGDARAIVLNFTELALHEQWWDRAPRHAAGARQRRSQQLLAFGLSEHYRQIFELTRLDEAVGIHDTESEALAAAGAT